MEKQVMVDLKNGVDPNWIARFVQVANQYACTLYIQLDDQRRVSAKSIMGMMNFSARSGETVIIKADGQDEAEAVKALEACLTGKV